MRRIIARLRRRHEARGFQPTIDKVHATRVAGRGRWSSPSLRPEILAAHWAEWKDVPSSEIARLARELTLTPFEIFSMTKAEVFAALEALDTRRRGHP